MATITDPPMASVYGVEASGEIGDQQLALTYVDPVSSSSLLPNSGSSGSSGIPGGTSVLLSKRYDFVNVTVWDTEVKINGFAPGNQPLACIVGEKIQAAVTITPNGLEGFSYQWAISDGEPIASYSPTNSSAVVYPLTKNKNGDDLLKLSSFTYYYTAGANATTVTASVTDSGGNVVRKSVDVAVLRPTVDSFIPTETSRRPAIDLTTVSVGFYDDISVRFGDADSPGVSWEATVTSPLGTGKIAVVQLVETNIDAIMPTRDANSPNAIWHRSTGGQFFLDAAYPYPVSSVANTNAGEQAKINGWDAPGMHLNGHDYGDGRTLQPMSYYNRTDHFKTYLVFKPDGGIYVTLAKFDWNWAVMVTRSELNDTLSINACTDHYYVSGSSDCVELPTYGKNNGIEAHVDWVQVEPEDG